VLHGKEDPEILGKATSIQMIKKHEQTNKIVRCFWYFQFIAKPPSLDWRHS